MSDFRATYGFDRPEVGLHNWRERPYSKWSFSRVSEVVPSALVPGARAPALPRGRIDSALLDERLDIAGQPQTLAAYLDASETDSLLVARDGHLIGEWHAPHATPEYPHLLFSVTKSITAMLTGVLEDRGLLDISRPIAAYLPDAAASGFADASVRQALDMRLSLDFTEEYLNRNGDYARYRRSTLWNPRQQGDRQETLDKMLFSLPKGAASHGGPFHYQSPVSDVLGLLVERVAGQPYPEFLSHALWQPMGAHGDAMMTVDAKGNPRGAGGLCVRPEDLLRVGQLILDGGVAGGRQLLSQRWIDDMATNGDAEAWAKGNFQGFLPGGRYRSQWYAPAAPEQVVMAIGIHGQWLFVCPRRRIAIVKLSSQALPQDDAKDAAALECLTHLADIVGG